MITDPLQDIRHFSPTLTISQVLTFFQRKGMRVTKGMVQNYIRDGLMPSPVNGRQYTHNHLAALVAIYRLKAVFDLPTIKLAMGPYMVEDGLPIAFYHQLMETLALATATVQQAIAPILATEADGGTLLTMTLATALKASVVE